MANMWTGFNSESAAPSGHTYAGILVRLAVPALDRPHVLGALRQLRFTGWLGPEEQGWVVAVAERGGGAGAAGRRRRARGGGGGGGRVGAAPGGAPGGGGPPAGRGRPAGRGGGGRVR